MFALVSDLKTKTIPFLVSFHSYKRPRAGNTAHARGIPAIKDRNYIRKSATRRGLRSFFSTDRNFFRMKIGGNKKYVYICSPKTAVLGSRRDAGVVDRAALEMRCTGNCTGGSNPSLSAIKPDNQDFILSTPNFTPQNVKLGVFFEMG